MVIWKEINGYTSIAGTKTLKISGWSYTLGNFTSCSDKTYIK